MALILLAGAGYAWYQASQQSDAKNIYPLDPSLETLFAQETNPMSSVGFLPREFKSGLMSNAITTVTFCKGDYRTIRHALEIRVQEILIANPWLGGWYVALCPIREQMLVQRKTTNRILAHTHFHSTHTL